MCSRLLLSEYVSPLRMQLLVDELIRAKHFYYTDLSDESNPINLLYGPLDLGQK